MSALAPRSVLLAGLPRSGTTWISRSLSLCEGVTLVHEPDNERRTTTAMAAKAELGRYPLLANGDVAAGYRLLFESALRGEAPSGARRRAWADRVARPVDRAEVDRVIAGRGNWPWRLALARRLTAVPRPAADRSGVRLVKSVNCALAVEWLAETVRPDAIAVNLRHPANVIGSWQELGYNLRNFPWEDERLWERHGPAPELRPASLTRATFMERAAWQFALLANALLAAAERTGCLVIDHESVLEDPAQELAGVAKQLGLEWTDQADEWVRETNRPGEGYQLNRDLDEQRGRWRDRLAPHDMATIEAVLGRFPRLGGRWPMA
jgi:hypothetical protein